MSRSIIRALAAAAAAVALHGSASAQSVGVEVYADPAPDYYAPPGYSVEYGYAPPFYGYAPPPEGPVIMMRPAWRNGCGVFRYWDGVQCVDARDVPPDVR